MAKETEVDTLLSIINERLELQQEILLLLESQARLVTKSSLPVTSKGIFSSVSILSITTCATIQRLIRRIKGK